jgi:hypothetical protein
MHEYIPCFVARAQHQCSLDKKLNMSMGANLATLKCTTQVLYDAKSPCDAAVRIASKVIRMHSLGALPPTSSSKMAA